MNISKFVMSTIFSLTAMISGTAFAACVDDYPIQVIESIGGGQSPTVNKTLTTSFKGHFTSTDGLTNRGKNMVKICPGTEVGYLVTSTVGEPTIETVVTDTGLRSGPVEMIVETPPMADCSTGSVEGYLVIGDKLSCNNKNLGGSDTDTFAIKAGM